MENLGLLQRRIEMMEDLVTDDFKSLPTPQARVNFDLAVRPAKAIRLVLTELSFCDLRWLRHTECLFSLPLLTEVSK